MNNHVQDVRAGLAKLVRMPPRPAQGFCGSHTDRDIGKLAGTARVGQLGAGRDLGLLIPVEHREGVSLPLSVQVASDTLKRYPAQVPATRPELVVLLQARCCR